MSVVFNDLPIVYDTKYGGNGYFSGTEAGIVTFDDKPVARELTCFDADTLEVVRKVWSFNNGHYLIPNLNPAIKYMIIARDYKNEFDPFGFDHYTPETKLTYTEQQELLAQWETS